MKKEKVKVAILIVAIVTLIVVAAGMFYLIATAPTIEQEYELVDGIEDIQKQGVVLKMDSVKVDREVEVTVGELTSPGNSRKAFIIVNQNPNEFPIWVTPCWAEPIWNGTTERTHEVFLNGNGLVVTFSSRDIDVAGKKVGLEVIIGDDWMNSTEITINGGVTAGPKAPGFEAVFAIAGLLAVVYLRRKIKD